MEKDHNVYVKENGRYKPIGYWWEGNHEYLTEGVWVVTKRRSCSGITSGSYIKELYGIDKVSDLKTPSFAELGGIHKLQDEVIDIVLGIDKDKWYNSSLSEQVGMIFGAIHKLSREKIEHDN